VSWICTAVGFESAGGAHVSVGDVGEVIVDVTTSVVFETAVEEPDVFVAVTSTRIAAPTSLLVSRYDCMAAPVMDEQLLPLVSQRFHWNLYDIGSLPLHVPELAISVCPSFAVPETLGLLVDEGA
jgi:hypothetical protein